MFLQETFVVEDLKFYNTLTDSSADNYLIRTGITSSYTTNGLKVTNGNWKDLVFSTQIIQGTKIEFDITEVGGSATPKLYIGFFDSYSQGNAGITNYQPNTTGHIKIEYQNNTVQLWLNDTLLTDAESSSTSPTVTTTPLYLKLSTGGQRQFTIKNMKIKAL